MNTEIVLNKIASYTEEAKLKTDKDINLIYGLNGVGKTILSNYLYEKNNNTNNFKYCKDNFNKDVKILVYNEKFIEDNFYEKDKIKGVFTLSSENRQALENIERAKEELKKLQDKEDEFKKEKERIENKFKQEKEKIYNKTWKIKETYTGGDRPLDYCLEGFKAKKETLFEHLKNLQKPEEPKEKIEALEEELTSIKKGVEQQPITGLGIKLDSIENQPVFKEEIVGSQNSSVVDLIKQLKNSDWVKKGLEYLPPDITESTQCPFCQEETITQNLVDNIKKYFDDSYREKINRISDFQSQYKDMITDVEEFKTSNLENGFIKKKKDQFENLISKLKENLGTNLRNIENKKNNPSQKISLERSNKNLDNLNQFIDSLNQDISEYNEKIGNSKKEKGKIKDTFWKIMRYQYDGDIESYNDAEKNWSKDKEECEKDIGANKEKIQEQQKVIQENQKRTINVDQAVDNINKNFRDLGIEDFKIEKQTGEEAYFLKRLLSSEDSKFKSFSEGEKTIISFLYFLELCTGRTEKDEVSNQKVIVIDDPISSLSHIYIFNIAQFIKNNFFDNNNNEQQVFVLTHSLYFFHEIARYRKGKPVKFFRITKDNSSKIHPMEKKDIKNNYESYWEILKDYQKDGKNIAVLPNVMRNIIEHFFGFIDKEDALTEVLEKIDEQKYGAFIRYMNRESHSVRENINDIKEIDHNLFFTAFKEIFEKSDHQKHYDKMMNNDK